MSSILSQVGSRSVFLTAAVLIFAVFSNFAQSTSQDFPTPVTSNEIVGTINARDIGDPRLTSYFYAFDGTQGDMFINLVTKNLSGDIDVFTISGLRPLTKVVVYADLGETETGRVVYLRKPEKLLLRVQGRTPNDDPATFQIKFAGSFVALDASSAEPEPKLPKIDAEILGGVRVNSVGTIIPLPPAPDKGITDADARVDAAKEPVAGDIEPAKIAKAEGAVDDGEKPDKDKADANADAPQKPLEVVVTEGVPATPKKVTARRTRPARSRPAKSQQKERVREVDPETVVEAPADAATPAAKPAPKLSAKEVLAETLKSIRLVIVFKDGGKIERPMSEVLRFNVDRGVLTVISKDGSIGRYSILDVAKVTIE